MGLDYYTRLIPRLLALASVAVLLRGHDIPRDVTVELYLKPEAQRLQLLVRVPLSAMRDIRFPEREGGALDFERADFLMADAAQLWLAGALDVLENDKVLSKPRVRAVRAALESDRSFGSYSQAVAHLEGPRLDNSVKVAWNQLFLDVWFEYDLGSESSRVFSVDPKFARLGQRVLTVLRWIPTDGVVRALQFTGDPGLIRLDPSWTQAAARFVVLGFEHILQGTDHLLFLLCLVIPIRRFMKLVPVVTAFTVAHSITLIGSAYGLAPGALWFPPLVEVLIAASIVYMALENIVKSSASAHRWVIAFAFGLVHGFGFSFALRETLQFAGSHLLTSLVTFNLGVELGQLLALLIAIPLLELLFRRVVAERMGTILLSALIAHTSWHWMVERYGTLSQFQFSMPSLDAAFWAGLLRWAAIGLVALGALKWIANAVSRMSGSGRRAQGANADSDI